MHNDRASEKLRQIRTSTNKQSVAKGRTRPPLRFVQIKTAVPANVSFEAITLEISIAAGIPRIEMLGFNNSAAHDARLRISAAIKNSGFKMPGQRITVAISAGVRIDYQVALDLPIALGILLASSQIKLKNEIAAAGSISLNGDVHSFASELAVCSILAKTKQCLILPAALERVSPLFSCKGFFVDNLKDMALPETLKRIPGNSVPVPELAPPDVNLAQLKGQYHALRALQIAACGRHSLCLLGTAGSGKSELLGLLPWLLPDLAPDAWHESLLMHSLIGEESLFINSNMRPSMRVIHPGASRNQILGVEGKKFGEWQLSKHGVLFLEEVTNMPPSQISLIQELMDKDLGEGSDVQLAHRNPGNHLLLAAGNPCPCGRYFERDGSCKCAIGDVRRRLGKIHAAFRERFDLWLSLRSPDSEDQRLSLSYGDGLDLPAMKKQVTAAVELAKTRFLAENSVAVKTGVENEANLRNFAGENLVQIEALSFAETIGNKKKLSLRQYRKLFSIARSIADLDADYEVKKPHFIEASQYIITDFQDL